MNSRPKKVPGFSLLDERNVISSVVDSDGIVRDLQLKRLDTFERRSMILGREARDAFSNLESLRVGDEHRWKYNPDNIYKKRLKRLFPGTVMPESIYQFLWFIDYLRSTVLLGREIAQTVFGYLTLSPSGLFDLLLESPGKPSRKKAVTCGGKRYDEWEQPEFFEVMRRGYDGVALALMIDDGIHWNGLVENDDGYSSCNTIFEELMHQVDYFLNRIEGLPYIDNLTYDDVSREKDVGLWDESYTEEVLLLVDKLLHTYVEDNKVDVTEDLRRIPFVVKYENNHICLVSPESSHYGWFFGAGLELDIDRDWGFTDDIKEADVDLIVLEEEPKKTVKILPIEIRDKFRKLIKLAEYGKPGPALVWGKLAWARRYWWHPVKGYNECVRDTLVAAYEALDRPLLVDVVKKLWDQRI